MPQMSPMLWMILTISMLISYLILLNIMPKFPIVSLKSKETKSKKIYMKW